MRLPRREASKLRTPVTALLSSLALALPIFVVDIIQRGDVAVAVLYGLVVLAALRAPGHRAVIAMAALCSVLSVIGGVIPVPHSAEWALVVKNRSISMLAIWGTALAGLRVRDMALLADRGEARLRESEARFQTVFDSVRDPIFVHAITADGRPLEFLEANEAAFDTYAYSRAEIQRMNVSQLVSGPEIVERFPELVQRMRSEGSILVEAEHRTKDGRAVPVEVRAQLIEFDGREAVLAVARDISERKRAEEAIRESERRERARADELEALMEAVPAIVFIAHDPEGHCITGNRAACDLLRMPLGSNLSQSASDGDHGRTYRSYDGERQQDPSELPVQRAARGEEVWGYEERIRFDDGSECHLYCNAVPLRDKQGDVRGALAAAVDVTERKRIEERLQRLTEELEQRVEARTADLVASDRALAQRTRQLQQLTSQLTQVEQRERRKLSRILHDDIQQLLTAVKLQLEMLKRADAEALPAAVERVTGHLDEAIQSARALSHELSPQILYDSGLGDALHWLAGRKMEKYELTLHVDTDPAAEPASESVRVLLFQAVRELLLNVVKHARVTEASVAMRPAGPGRLCLSVSDQGKGFDSEALYERLDGAEHLGLFGIRERLESIGGDMAVESAPGQGTTVHLYAPLAACSPEPDHEEAAG